jgi:peptidoglycan/xylan/chitin deacetylase (PgdA/CDA1 family)
VSSPGATIALCYHRVGRLPHDPFGMAVTPEHFAEQLDVIRRHRPLALADLAAQIRGGDVRPGGIAVTFDDGYRDNLAAAAPALERAGVPATVFVTTGLTGTRDAVWWEELDDLVLSGPPPSPVVTLQGRVDARAFRFDGPGGQGGGGIEIWAWIRSWPLAEIEAVLEQLRAWRGRGPLERDDALRVMDADELRALRGLGLIDVGAHTRTHPVLAARSPEVQRAEIAGSRADLEAWLDGPIRGFAYPFGKPGPEFTPQTAELVRDAGFDWACAIHPRPVTRRTRVHEIPRHVPPDIGGDDFERWLRERLHPPGAARRSALAAGRRVRGAVIARMPAARRPVPMSTGEDEPPPALVRRADWRLLLPAGPQRRAVVFGDGDLAASAALVAETVIGPSGAAGCDLAVATAPRAAHLRAAFAALDPGGTLYAEWPRPAIGGERGIRRRLRAAGFEDVRCTFAWPLPARGVPAYWLPLGSRGAASHLFETHSREPGVRGRLAATGRAAVWRLARALGVLPLTVTATRGVADGGLADLLGRALHIDGGGAPDLLLLTGGDSVLNKVVALPFAAGDACPRAAVKLARVPRSRRALANECRILEHLAPHAIPGVPLILASGTWGESPLVAESMVHGRPLWRHLAAGGAVEPVLERATDLLIGVAQATAEPATEPFGGWRERIEREAALSLARYPASGETLAAAQALLEPLDDVPATLLHGDCTPWNLTVAPGGAVGLLDWESSIVDGLPLFDLTYLLGYSAIYADGVADTPAEPESYRRLLDPGSSRGELRARLEQRYAAATGLPPQALRALRIATWIFQHRPDLVAVELGAA